MVSMVLKIIEFPDGSIGLMQDEEREPLVHIRFSDTAMEYIGENRMKIASSMFQAGITESYQQLKKDDQDENSEREKGNHEDGQESGELLREVTDGAELDLPDSSVKITVH